MGAFVQGFRMGGDLYHAGAKLKMTREQHAKEMEELGLRNRGLQRQEDRDIAQRGYDDQLLALYGGGGAAAPAMPGAEGVPPQGVPMQGGMQVPQAAGVEPQAMGMRPPGQVQPNFADPEFQNQMTLLLKQRALAGGDTEGFGRLNQAALQQQYAREDSEFARAVVSDPTGAIAKQARTWINDSSPHITVRAGKDGFSTFIVAKGDGYDEVNVSPSDLGMIAVGMKRLERGDVTGLELIYKVNKDLAAAVRDDMKLTLDVGKENNDVAYKRGALANDAERTRIIGQSADNRATREISQETLTQLNNLSSEIEQEADPAKKRALQDQWTRLYATAATEMGRTVTPRSMEADPLAKERFAAFIEALAALGPKPPPGSVQQLVDYFRVGHLVGGGTGGLPGWGEPQAQAPAAPTEAPAEAPRRLGIRDGVTPERAVELERILVVPDREGRVRGDSWSHRHGLPPPNR